MSCRKKLGSYSFILTAKLSGQKFRSVAFLYVRSNGAGNLRRGTTPARPSTSEGRLRPADPPDLGENALISALPQPEDRLPWFELSDDGEPVRRLPARARPVKAVRHVVGAGSTGDVLDLDALLDGEDLVGDVSDVGVVHGGVGPVQAEVPEDLLLVLRQADGGHQAADLEPARPGFGLRDGRRGGEHVRRKGSLPQPDGESLEVLVVADPGRPRDRADPHRRHPGGKASKRGGERELDEKKPVVFRPDFRVFSSSGGERFSFLACGRNEGRFFSEPPHASDVV
ncbi:MAG: hypothetical protein BJ554DRAFT_6102 [Olpidium bornovanus]|uniref:Uncharacterized protein n=1 Tax=Olpidium bornovanus TaxID=278681 RepID=A0A8H8A239_9FUNG|nr:MAG: hypothetical protein BJ554DRAFT_6102 [Olpidium bornovanus]